MLLQNNFIFISISFSLTIVVVSGLEEDEGFLGEPEYLPDKGNWFRVNRKGGKEEQVRPQRDVVADPKVFESEDDELGQEETYTRNRRLYTPPAIVHRDGGRSSPSPVHVQQRGDGGEQCRCDMEYVLKYRGVQPRGEYQVKVYHEETGKFTGEDHNYNYHDNHDHNHHRGWNRGDHEYVDRKEKVPPALRNKYDYYTEPPRQQQQQQQQDRSLQRQSQNVQQQERPRYQYYVEEVVDDGGDPGSSGERRRGEVFLRGNGPSKSRVVRRPPVQMLRKNRKLVKLARFIVSKAEWGMVGIISGKGSDFGGYPFSEYFRMSDGIVGNGSGIPYVYMRMQVLEACGDDGDLEV